MHALEADLAKIRIEVLNAVDFAAFEYAKDFHPQSRIHEKAQQESGIDQAVHDHLRRYLRCAPQGQSPRYRH